jgi:dTDP-4-dehydrorhamnose 3,5-epimerase
MIFSETKLQGAYLIRLERLSDERGYFARTWCFNEMAEHGLNTSIVQGDVSFNVRKGTLRGMHYQVPPFAEVKLVRCTRGALFDVIIDLRPHSKTFLRWVGEVLTPGNGTMMYVPEGFAHGFLTLEDDTEVFYLMSNMYSPAHARGVRWDDPAFGIKWPAEVMCISQRDREIPEVNKEALLRELGG